MGMSANERRIGDAQIALLGSLLISPEIAGDLMQRVNPDDFGGGTMRTLFDACRNGRHMQTYSGRRHSLSAFAMRLPRYSPPAALKMPEKVQSGFRPCWQSAAV